MRARVFTLQSTTTMTTGTGHSSPADICLQVGFGLRARIRASGGLESLRSVLVSGVRV